MLRQAEVGRKPSKADGRRAPQGRPIALPLFAGQACEQVGRGQLKADAAGAALQPRMLSTGRACGAMVAAAGRRLDEACRRAHARLIAAAVRTGVSSALEVRRSRLRQAGDIASVGQPT